MTVIARLASTHTALVSQSLVGLCFAFPSIINLTYVFWVLGICVVGERERERESSLLLWLVHVPRTSYPKSLCESRDFLAGSKTRHARKSLWLVARTLILAFRMILARPFFKA